MILEGKLTERIIGLATDVHIFPTTSLVCQGLLKILLIGYGLSGFAALIYEIP